MLGNLLLIALGGAIGSMLRYLLSNLVFDLTQTVFPFGTLVVNILGCFLIGILSVLLLKEHLRNLIIIGFLGGFTTFSSFSLDAIDLFQSGFPLQAITYSISTLLACLGGCWVGVLIGNR